MPARERPSPDSAPAWRADVRGKTSVNDARAAARFKLFTEAAFRFFIGFLKSPRPMPRRSSQRQKPTAVMNFFGPLSLGNIVDWGVTLGAVGLLGYVTFHLGGVRPETLARTLWMTAGLLTLHGVWYAVQTPRPPKLARAPWLFLPLVLWVAASAMWMTPAPWRGRLDLIVVLVCFANFWVLCNHARSRYHQDTFWAGALAPVGWAMFLGFVQFFRSPERINSSGGDANVRLAERYLGQAVGSFADPASFATLMLVAIALAFPIMALPRFPKVIRVFFAYVILMALGALYCSGVHWAWLALFALIPVAGALSFRTVEERVRRTMLLALLLFAATAALATYNDSFARGLGGAGGLGEVESRERLWGEARRIAGEHPWAGVGAGAAGLAFAQSSKTGWARVPETAHNDVLTLLMEYGAVGLALFAVPLIVLLVRAWRRRAREPYFVRYMGSDSRVASPRRFYLTAAFCGMLALGLAAWLSFPSRIPALGLYGAAFLAVLARDGGDRRLTLPDGRAPRAAIAVAFAALGWIFALWAMPHVQAEADRLAARQQLDHLLGERAGAAERGVLFDLTVNRFRSATALDPSNADAWVGLSEARASRFYVFPAGAREVGRRAAQEARRAIRLAPEYWRGWAALGVARALEGRHERAEKAFDRALEIAPRHPNALYAKAAFLSHFSGRGDEALELVERSLRVHPTNERARRLRKKLLIP